MYTYLQIKLVISSYIYNRPTAGKLTGYIDGEEEGVYMCEACGCGRVLYAGGGAHTKHVYSLLVWPDVHHTHAVTAYVFVYETAFEYMLLPYLKICVCLLSYFSS